MDTISTGGVQHQTSLATRLRRVALGAGAVLLLPLVAMRFTREVDWGPADFLAAFLLLFGIGSAWVLCSRTLRTPGQRRAAGAGLLVAGLLIWAELAVGIFGSPIAGS